MGGIECGVAQTYQMQVGVDLLLGSYPTVGPEKGRHLAVCSRDGSATVNKMYCYHASRWGQQLPPTL